MTINVVTSDGIADISELYRFTIFESHTEQQRDLTSNYKFGGDIWWDLKDPNIITLLPIKEA